MLLHKVVKHILWLSGNNNGNKTKKVDGKKAKQKKGLLFLVKVFTLT